jgi:hypothetical protein
MRTSDVGQWLARPVLKVAIRSHIALTRIDMGTLAPVVEAGVLAAMCRFRRGRVPIRSKMIPQHATLE